jgi:DNA polymerase-3 subunit alpha
MPKKYQKVPMSHLHIHSNYSELDAISKIPDIVQRATEFGWDSICLTDHGNIGGIPQFHKECRKKNIKPILGSEFYFVPDAKPPTEDMDKETRKAIRAKQRKKGHLILMAMDYEGWINIQKLVTRANSQFYYSPTIGFADLEEFSNGIICLSGCMKNQINQAILAEEYDVAVKYVLKYRQIFGDRFYLEVQDGGLDIQLLLNPVIRRMGKKYGIKVVATQDSHYIDRNDSEGHEGIWAIRTKSTFDKPTESDIKFARGRCEDEQCGDPKHRHDCKLNECRMYYSTKEYWLKDGHHMLNENIINEFGESRPADILQSEVEESAAIAGRVMDFDIKTGLHLPKYTFIPIEIEEKEKEDPQYAYLKKLVLEGYENVYGITVADMPEEHSQRLKKEMLDIKDAALADYFLIVWDIIEWARNAGIKVGPGRGSAAGSMVSYCLGITKIEPLQYGLIWERFYNIGRKGSLADIDSDFPKSRRMEVVNYIGLRFGKDRVCQIGTWQKMKSKAALKDAAKILGSKGGMPFDDANVMTRLIPNKHNVPVSISEAIEMNDKIREYSEKFPRLFAIAKKLEGCPRGRGTHAAGVVISDEPFTNGFPLRWNTTLKDNTTEYDMEVLDELGYLKMDVLGISTMDVLTDIEQDVKFRSMRIQAMLDVTFVPYQIQSHIIERR